MSTFHLFFAAPNISQNIISHGKISGPNGNAHKFSIYLKYSLVYSNPRWILFLQAFSRLLYRMAVRCYIHVSYVTKTFSLWTKKFRLLSFYWGMYSFRSPVPCEGFILFPGSKIQNPVFRVVLCGPGVEIKTPRPWIKMVLIKRESCDMPWERRLNNISDTSYVQVDNKGKKFSQIWSPLGEERNSCNERGYFVLFYSSRLAPMEKIPNMKCLPGTGQFPLIQVPVPFHLLSFFAWLEVIIRAYTPFPLGL